jgi:putative transposase
MPFTVRAISVDNGSEFMARFETACAILGAACTCCLRARPSATAPAQRANRAHTENSHQVTDAELDLPSLRAAAHSGRDVCNHVRPHQAFGYLTQTGFLATLGIQA